MKQRHPDYDSNFNWDPPSKRRKYFVEDSFSNASVCKDKKVKNDSRVESEAGKQHGQDGFHPLPLFSIFTNQKQHQIKAPKKRKCNKREIIPPKNFRFKSLSSHFVRSNHPQEDNPS